MPLQLEVPHDGYLPHVPPLLHASTVGAGAVQVPEMQVLDAGHCVMLADSVARRQSKTYGVTTAAAVGSVGL